MMRERYMEGYQKCIIAFLDILGFKQLIHKKEFNEIRAIFSSIFTNEDAVIALHRANDGDESLDSYNQILKDKEIHILSDSIVIAAPSDKPEALAVVVDICNCIQQQLYELDIPVFLRGAISKGDFYSEGNLIFGEGLIDAYLAEEYYAVYPRIILSDEIVDGMIISVCEEKKLPKDKDGYYYLDTLKSYFDCDSFNDLLHSDRYKRISEYVELQLKGYGDNNVREKYLWLKAELRKIREALN